jgi:hypothetical protein
VHRFLLPQGRYGLGERGKRDQQGKREGQSATRGRVKGKPHAGERKLLREGMVSAILLDGRPASTAARFLRRSKTQLLPTEGPRHRLITRELTHA